MSNPISRMTDATKQSIIENLSTLETDWRNPETRAAELLGAIKDAVIEGNWEGLRNFLYDTVDSVSKLRESNMRSPEVDDSKD